MTATPLFNRLHAETFTEQCDACRDQGWPVGTFMCLTDDLTCIDYY